MKKKRKDGTLVKMDPLFRIVPLIMEERADAQVYYEEDISISAIDEYIRKKQEEGIKLGYMHIIYSALIRTMYTRPGLNQFIMKGRQYRRNEITVSLMVKKNMSVEGEETSVKMDFRGDETPEEVKERLNEMIEKEKSGAGEDNDMDALVKVLDKIPDWLLRKVVRFLKFLDRHNMMPYPVIKASPFHASAFVTNMGSLGITAIYHHIYNFGTVGIFLAIGRKNKSLKMVKGEVVEEKTLKLAFVSDERICDGYYYATALKQFFRYLKRPELLEQDNLEIKE